MKRKLILAVTAVLLLLGAFGFAGCDKGEETIKVSYMIYEVSDPYTYVGECTQEEPYITIRVPYDGKERDYNAKAKFPDGTIKKLEIGYHNLIGVNKSQGFAPEGSDLGALESWRDFTTVKDKGRYEYDFDLSNTGEYKNLESFYAMVTIIVY